MEQNGKVERASCAGCPVSKTRRICVAEKGKPGPGCPTLLKGKILEEVIGEYKKEDVREFAIQASVQEAACYANRGKQPYILQPTKTRMIEICEFADRMGYRRLGLAFCSGLSKEAVIVEDILNKRGFEVASVVCKAGRLPKGVLGLTEEDTVRYSREEAMCNPIFQARVLNHEAVDLNIILGLCVGHDSLFFKYAEAPTTVLAVKDRVTGHNPLAAIYLSDSYYGKIKEPGNL